MDDELTAFRIQRSKFTIAFQRRASAQPLCGFAFPWLMNKRLFFIALFIGLMSFHLHAQTSKDYFSHLQPQHRDVLKKWLAHRPWLRPATEDDCEDKGNLALMRRDLGRKVHPYYSVADFNGDGKNDFAVLLDRKSTRLNSSH